jgi:hypothetical protein
MRKFVQPRRWYKRIIIRTEAKKASWRRLFLYYHRQKLVAGASVLAVVYMLFFFNRAPIQRVEFSQGSIDQLQYDQAFESIEKWLINSGYIKWKWRNKSSWIAAIRKEFPLIQSISPSFFKDGTLTLDIRFAQPDFLMTTQDKAVYLVYHNMIIPLASWSMLWSTWLAISIALPDKILQDFSGWVFWANSSTDIAHSIKQINFLSGGYDTTYYPWREKWIIRNGNRTYIFSLNNKKLQDSFPAWKKTLPYLPTAAPVQLDLSSPHRIIIK